MLPLLYLLVHFFIREAIALFDRSGEGRKRKEEGRRVVSLFEMGEREGGEEIRHCRRKSCYVVGATIAIAIAVPSILTTPLEMSLVKRS